MTWLVRATNAVHKSASDKDAAYAIVPRPLHRVAVASARLRAVRPQVEARCIDLQELRVLQRRLCVQNVFGLGVHDLQRGVKPGTAPALDLHTCATRIW